MAILAKPGKIWQNPAPTPLLQPAAASPAYIHSPTGNKLRSNLIYPSKMIPGGDKPRGFLGAAAACGAPNLGIPSCEVQEWQE